MESRLNRILALARSHVPNLRLVEKRRVWWMRGVAWLLRPVVPDFSSRYTTVFGRTVYLPKPARAFPPQALAITLAHELVHQIDQQRWGPLFYLSYGFVLPTGRTMRAYWERRAYAVDLLLARERGGEPAVRRVAEALVEVFSGSSYLWMWVGRDASRAYLEPVVVAVLAGRLDEVEPYAEILAAWRGEAEPVEPSATLPDEHGVS